MISVELVTAASTLRSMFDVWLVLASSALEPNPFFHPGFFLPLVEELGWPTGAAVIVARERDGTLLALLPVVVARGGPGRIVPVLRSAYNPTPVHSLLATPLLDRERAPEAVDAILDALDQRSLPGVLLELVGHAIDGPFGRLLEARLAERGQPSLVLPGLSRPLLRPQRSGEAYLEEALGGRHRRELGRQRRQLQRQGQLRFTGSRPGEPMGPWSERFLALEAAGWKGNAGTALANDPRDRRFFERACRELAAHGALSFVALELDRRPIAMACLLREAASGGGAFVFKIAYDETFRRQSPGMQLLLEQLREIHEPTSAIGWVDSCASPRDTLYSQLWLDRRLLGHQLLGPRSLTGRMLLMAARGVDRLRRRARRRPDLDPTASSGPVRAGRGNTSPALPPEVH
jgi:CelD/BcsL family acetyltransferase involved in cellulose biosynthesis